VNGVGGKGLAAVAVSVIPAVVAPVPPRAPPVGFMCPRHPVAPGGDGYFDQPSQNHDGAARRASHWTGPS
jgi:hypothetical protein